MKVYLVRLKDLREESKLTVAQLATETGFSKSAIQYWESGQRVPSVAVLIKLAQYFGVTTDYILDLNN